MSQDGQQNTANPITVLYFASARDFVGRRSCETIECTGPITYKTFLALLEEKYPGFREKVLHSSAIAINYEYVDDSRQEDEHLPILIRPGDEVAIIPPVSAG